jgi:energy-coupling factor transport system permease protein
MTTSRPHSLALVFASAVPALTVVWTVDPLTPILIGLVSVTSLVTAIRRPRIPWGRIGIVTVTAAIMSVTSFLYAHQVGAVYAEWGLVTISDGSFHVALAAFVRILAIGIPAVLVLSDVEPHELIATTVVRRVVPQRAALAALIALRLAPVIAADLVETRVARRAAGLSTRFSSLVVTTLVIAIRRAIRMSEIAEVRGFSAPDRVWTSYRSFARKDWALVSGIVGAAMVALTITATTGLWNSAI